MDKVEASISAAVAKGSGKNGIPGAVLAVVDKDGNYLYKKVFGNAGIESDARPLQFDATYSIASCTKLITSIAALQTVERGQISLDDPLDKIIPEFTSQPIIEPKASSEINNDDKPFTLKPATKPVTLRHLLTHTSGAAYEFSEPLIGLWKKSPHNKNDAPPGTVLGTYAYPRRYEAGEGWQYSSSLDWAGVVIGRLNDTTLDQFAEENIFKPLGMTSTTFFPDSKSGVRQRLMPLSVREEDGTLTPGGPSLFAPNEPVEPMGGVGLYSSVQDYTRVLADLLKETPTILKTESVKQLFSPQFKEGSKTLEGLIHEGLKGPGSYQPLIGGTIEGYIGKFNYGLGGILVEDDIERSDYLAPKGTLSWSGLPNLVWKINRERGLATFFATQIRPYNDAVAFELVQEFETAVWRNFTA